MTTQDKIFKRIAIVVAMPSEFDLMRHILETPQPLDIAGSPCLKGYLSNKEVLLMQNGIGKVNAAVQVSELIAAFQPDAVINSGVAGGIGAGLQVGDIVAGNACTYHDVWCGEGTWGQIQGLPALFDADTTLLSTLKTLSIERLTIGLICTGDQFISELSALSTIKKNFPEAQAVDMESCAIAHVCYLRQIPFLSLRVISDTPGMEENNAAQYNDFWENAPKRTFQVIHDLITHL